MRKQRLFKLISLVVAAILAVSTTALAEDMHKDDSMPMMGMKTDAGYIDVTPEEALQLITDTPDLVIIDVSPKYAEGHLPGALNYYIGDGTLDKAIPMLDMEKPYLVYCHVDSASIPGATALVEAGFSPVYRLLGNYPAWVEAGYDVSTLTMNEEIAMMYMDAMKMYTEVMEDAMMEEKAMMYMNMMEMYMGMMDEGTMEMYADMMDEDMMKVYSDMMDKDMTDDTMMDKDMTDTDMADKDMADDTMMGMTTEAGYIDLTPEEAMMLIEATPDLVIIDVSPKYDEGHLPGAMHYYLGDGSLDDALPMLDMEVPYLVYCHVDSVSIAGATKLVEAGFSPVYRLLGNYGAWVAAGFPVE